MPSDDGGAVDLTMQALREVKRVELKNGDVYEGEWLDGRRHGTGVYRWRFDGSYEGDWDSSYQHGRGIRTYANGDVYDGEWSLDQRCGQGVMRYGSGEVYDGYWLDGQRHGVDGHMTYACGDTYSGEWQADQPHGDGVMVYAKRVQVTDDQIEDQISGRVEDLLQAQRDSRDALVECLVSALLPPEPDAQEEGKAGKEPSKDTKSKMEAEEDEESEEHAGDLEEELRTKLQGMTVVELNELGRSEEAGPIDESLLVQIADRTEVVGLLATLSLLECPSENLVEAIGVLEQPCASQPARQSLLQVQVEADALFQSQLHPLQQARHSTFAMDVEAAVEAAQIKANVVNKYEGHWVNGQREGIGRLIHTDGTSWAGQWVADEKHGLGTLFRVDGSVEMEGRWERGRLTDPAAQYQYQDYPHYVKIYEEAVEKAVREAKKAMAAIEKEQRKLTKAEAAHKKEQKARSKADKQAAAFEEMGAKERKEAEKDWVDPRSSMKQPEEWEELFSELQNGIRIAKEKAEEAQKVIANKEEELAAQVADRGPRRDQWQTTFQQGRLDKKHPFPLVPHFPLD